MKEYTYREIGMLSGIALSALFAVQLLSKSFNLLLLIAMIVSIPSLTLLGWYIDRRQDRNDRNKVLKTYFNVEKKG